MSVQAVLFDLDGTLLPVDTDAFNEVYIPDVAAYMQAELGIPNAPALIAQGLRETAALHPDRTNQQAFFEPFRAVVGLSVEGFEAALAPYYQTRYTRFKAMCGLEPRAAEALRLCKSKGFQTAVATNPFFPRFVLQMRAEWAGVGPDLYDLITDYAHHNFVKPHTEYYREVAEQLGVPAAACVMVGNDAREDLIAARTGMRTFYLTDYAINREHLPEDCDGRGSWRELLAFLRAL